MKKKLIKNILFFLIVSCQISLVIVQATDNLKNPQAMKENRKAFISTYQSLSEGEKRDIGQQLSAGDCELQRDDWDGDIKTFSTECIQELMKHTINQRR